MESGLDALREQIVRRLQQTGEELLGLVEQHRQEQQQDPTPSTAPSDAGLRPLRAAIASLDGADSQAEILARLLEVSSSFASRSALLLKTDAGLKVWSSTGFDESHEGRDVGAFDEGRWAEACSGRGASLLDSKACAHLAQALEADVPSQGAVVPLVLRDEVPAVLYADTENGVSPNLEALQLLTYTAAQCLETLPLRSERPVSTLVALEQDDEPNLDEATDDESWGGAAALGAVGTAAAGAIAYAEANDEEVAETQDEGDLEDTSAELAETQALEATPAPEEDELEDAEDGPDNAELETASDEGDDDEPELEADSALDEGEIERDEPQETAEDGEPSADVEAAGSDDSLPDESLSEESAQNEDGDDEPVLSAETRQVPTVDLPDYPDAAAQDAGSEEEASEEEDASGKEEDGASKGPSVFGIAQKAGAAAGAAALAAGSRLWGDRNENDDELSDDASESSVDEPAAGDPLSTLQTDAPSEPSSRSVYDEMGALDAPESPSADPVSSLETQVIRTGDLPSGQAEPAAPRVFGPPPPVTPPPAEDVSPPAPPASDAGSESAATSNQVMPPEDVHEGPGWAFTGSSSDESSGTSTTEGPLHEEARRLARLLVSEIKLYNEEQIEEGRRQGNIYEQLKDDIDRSKRMYEERIDQTVRQSTDYFRDELVRSLADGDAQVLGL